MKNWIIGILVVGGLITLFLGMGYDAVETDLINVPQDVVDHANHMAKIFFLIGFISLVSAGVIEFWGWWKNEKVS